MRLKVIKMPMKQKFNFYSLHIPLNKEQYKLLLELSELKRQPMSDIAREMITSFLADFYQIDENILHSGEF